MADETRNELAIESSGPEADEVERERLAQLCDDEVARLGRRLKKQAHALAAAVSASPARLAEMRAGIERSGGEADDWRTIASLVRRAAQPVRVGEEAAGVTDAIARLSSLRDRMYAIHGPKGWEMQVAAWSHEVRAIIESFRTTTPIRAPRDGDSNV